MTGRAWLSRITVDHLLNKGGSMSTAETIEVPHLGGSTIGYKFGKPYDSSLPTLVMSNSFSTSVELYRPQFADEQLNAAANVLAFEPYGHGRTRASYAQFTYWDSAIANLQALEALGIPQAFVLGTSQGGWVATRMAMLAPQVVQGIIPVGTSMDYESQRSREAGCWDGIAFCTPAIDALAAPVGDDWIIPRDLVDAVLLEGFGEDVPPEERSFWHAEHQKNYTGDAGRERLRIISINLRDRDGLEARLDSVRCPVLWMQGTADRVYSVANAQEEIKLFVNSRAVELRVVDGGQHFLSATHPDEVNAATVEFIKRWT
jgi:pimeloyl-ACP methyl ester carboxylesterase